MKWNLCQGSACSLMSIDFMSNPFAQVVGLDYVPPFKRFFHDFQ